jgi:hypothetical protein
MTFVPYLSVTVCQSRLDPSRPPPLHCGRRPPARAAGAASDRPRRRRPDDLPWVRPVRRPPARLRDGRLLRPADPTTGGGSDWPRSKPSPRGRPASPLRSGPRPRYSRTSWKATEYRPRWSPVSPSEWPSDLPFSLRLPTRR